MTDDYIRKIDIVVAGKEKEIMTVVGKVDGKGQGTSDK